MKLKVIAKGCLYYINTDEIVFIRAAGNGSELVLDTNEVLKTPKRIGEMEGELPRSSFFRVHKSYLVNLYHMTSLDYSSRTLHLEQDIKIPISRRKKAPFLELINLLEPGSPLD